MQSGPTTKGLIIRTLSAILNPGKVIGFLEKLQALDDTVTVEVDICERIHTCRMQATLQNVLIDTVFFSLSRFLEWFYLSTPRRKMALVSSVT